MVSFSGFSSMASVEIDSDAFPFSHRDVLAIFHHCFQPALPPMPPNDTVRLYSISTCPETLSFRKNARTMLLFVRRFKRVQPMSIPRSPLLACRPEKHKRHSPLGNTDDPIVRKSNVV